MDIVYLMLILLAAMSYLLGIEWLMLATIFLFAALLFSKFYNGGAQGASDAPPQIAHEMHSAETAKSPQPIIVMNSGGSGGGATITDNMIATMMGNLMAYDAYEQADKQKWDSYLSRGSRMRQGFIDHHGNITQKHKGFNREHSDAQLKIMKKMAEKLGVPKDELE